MRFIGAPVSLEFVYPSTRVCWCRSTIEEEIQSWYFFIVFEV